MHLPEFQGCIDRLISANSPQGEAAAMAVIGTMAGFAMGALFAQEKQTQVNTPQARNPYRNAQGLVTVSDLEQWVLQNQAKLDRPEVILKHLAHLPEQARLDQVTVTRLLTASR